LLNVHDKCECKKSANVYEPIEPTEESLKGNDNPEDLIEY
jgi:hypothetical protein